MELWLGATFLGFGLGLVLYIFVRLRMRIGPALRKRFGNSARRVYWLLTILAMVATANVGLIALRAFTGQPIHSPLEIALELWYIVVAVVLALGLIFRFLKRGKQKDEEGP